MMEQLRSLTAWSLAAACLLVSSVLVEAKDDHRTLESREYKLLLDTSKFASDAPSVITSLWDHDLKRIIDEALDLQENGEHRYSKEFKTSERRVVRFWDTTRPHPCTLNNHGYILRERVELRGDQENPDHRKVMLKLRGPDRNRVANIDMKGSREDAESKFEEDISPPFKSMFSVSTSQKLKGGDTLSTMSNVFDKYPDLKVNLQEDRIPVDPNDAMAVVSDLSIDEEVYQGPEVDLGNVKADISVSLWYKRGERPPTAPLIVELSFTHPLIKDSKDVKPKVLERAKALFSRLQTLAWISQVPETKTKFVYEYAKKFCE